MAILSKAPVPPRAFSRVANYASAIWGLKVARTVRANERGRVSEALRRAVRVRTSGRGVVRVGVPHYWAPFYHDGRGPAPRRERPKKWMVWFKDPGDDPRWGPGLPVLRREVRRLTKAEFRAGLEENRRRGPGNPFMIVAKSSPFDRSRTKANPFFDRAFRSVVQEGAEVDGIVEQAIDDIIDRKLRVSRAKPYTQSTARVRF